MEGTCATLNSHIQALKQSGYKAGYLFEGCYFGAIMGSAKLAKIYLPVKNTSYTDYWDKLGHNLFRTEKNYEKYEFDFTFCSF